MKTSTIVAAAFLVVLGTTQINAQHHRRGSDNNANNRSGNNTHVQRRGQSTQKADNYQKSNYQYDSKKKNYYAHHDGYSSGSHQKSYHHGNNKYYYHHGGSHYQYYQGRFYRNYNGYYRICPAPVGIRVQYIPQYHQRIVHGPATYFYEGGFFYRYNSYWGSYEVVRPPIGVVVTGIPGSAGIFWNHGQKFYSFNGVVYKRVWGRWGSGYQVVNVI